MSNFRQQTPAIIATSIFWLALFVAYVLFGQRHPQAEPIEIIPPTASAAEVDCPEVAAAPATPTTTPTPAPLRVYVSGAVINAGVYRLPPHSLVTDAIQEAGGATVEADLVAINLAQPLHDGEQIYVPNLEDSAPPPPPLSRAETAVETMASSPAPPALIDLNTASQEQLETLPGIGPAMAKRIIAGRPYHAVDDVLNVKGIGEAKLKKIKPLVTVK